MIFSRLVLGLPRVCGGTLETVSWIDPGMGLSPRVRGNRGQEVRIRSAVGSIPACAGEPCCVASKQDSHKVYPRVCGGTRSP